MENIGLFPLEFKVKMIIPHDKTPITRPRHAYNIAQTISQYISRVMRRLTPKREKNNEATYEVEDTRYNNMC